MGVINYSGMVKWVSRRSVKAVFRVRVPVPEQKENR